MSYIGGVIAFVLTLFNLVLLIVSERIGKSGEKYLKWIADALVRQHKVNDKIVAVSKIISFCSIVFLEILINVIVTKSLGKTLFVLSFEIPITVLLFQKFSRFLTIISEILSNFRHHKIVINFLVTSLAFISCVIISVMEDEGFYSKSLSWIILGILFWNHISIFKEMGTAMFNADNLLIEDHRYKIYSNYIGASIWLSLLIITIACEVYMFTQAHPGSFVFNNVNTDPPSAPDANYVNSFLDSLYFTVITFATIGFGDITPKGSWGEIETIVITFTSIFSLIVFLGPILQRKDTK